MAIINVPAPAGSALAGQIQMQAWQGLGQALGAYLGQRRQRQLWGQDQPDIQSYLRNRQVAQQAATATTGLGGQVPSWPGAQPQFPEMRSRRGREYEQAVLQAQLGNIFGDPYGLQKAQAGYYRARAEEAGRPPQVSPTQAMAQKKLDMINSLEAKISAGTATRQDENLYKKLAFGIAPKTLEDELQYWRNIEKSASAGDSMTGLMQLIAREKGTEYVPRTNEEVAEFARKEQTRILQQLRQRSAGGRISKSWAERQGITLNPPGTKREDTTWQPTVRPDAIMAPDFMINNKTGKPIRRFSRDGKEIGLVMKNGRIIRIGQQVLIEGKPYTYVGNNQWEYK